MASQNPSPGGPPLEEPEPVPSPATSTAGGDDVPPPPPRTGGHRSHVLHDYTTGYAVGMKPGQTTKDTETVATLDSNRATSAGVAPRGSATAASEFRYSEFLRTSAMAQKPRVRGSNADSKRYHTLPVTRGVYREYRLSTLLYPPHEVTWKVVGATGYVMPVLVPATDVGMSGTLIIDIQRVRGLTSYKKKFGELCTEVIAGSKNRRDPVKLKTPKTKPDPLDKRCAVWNATLKLPITHDDRTLRVRVLTYSKMLKSKHELGRVKIPISPLLRMLCPTDPAAGGAAALAIETSMSEMRKRAALIAANTFSHWFDLSNHGYTHNNGQILLGFRFVPEAGTRVRYFNTPVMHATTERKAELPGDAGTRFGLPLATAMKRSRYPCPEVCFQSVEFLRRVGLGEQGLFRKEPREATLRDLEKKFGSGFTVEFKDPHEAAGLLKRYFRALPEPLIPPLQLGPFIEAEKEPDAFKRVDKYKVIMATLPEVNRAVLRHLMGFLNQVHARRAENKMEARNIATCWVPSLVFPPEGAAADGAGPLDLETLRAMSGSEAIDCVATMIREQRDIFYVSESTPQRAQKTPRESNAAPAPSSLLAQPPKTRPVAQAAGAAGAPVTVKSPPEDSTEDGRTVDL